MSKKISAQRAIQKGLYSSSVGYKTVANGNASHAEGQNTRASNNASHAEGRNTWARGKFSHAQGFNTRAEGDTSTAIGRRIKVTGNYSVGVQLNDLSNQILSQDETFAVIGGNVGINTLNPEYKLQVVGDASFDNVLIQNNTITTSSGDLVLGSNEVDVKIKGSSVATQTDIVQQLFLFQQSLNLNTMASQSSDSVAIAGGTIIGITDLAIADGGTGASTAEGARNNLGLGTIAVQNSSDVSVGNVSLTETLTTSGPENSSLTINGNVISSKNSDTFDYGIWYKKKKFFDENGFELDEGNETSTTQEVYSELATIQDLYRYKNLGQISENLSLSLNNKYPEEIFDLELSENENDLVLIGLIFSSYTIDYPMDGNMADNIEKPYKKLVLRVKCGKENVRLAFNNQSFLVPDKYLTPSLIHQGPGPSYNSEIVNSDGAVLTSNTLGSTDIFTFIKINNKYVLVDVKRENQFESLGLLNLLEYNPEVAGKLWNYRGSLKISSGKVITFTQNLTGSQYYKSAGDVTLTCQYYADEDKINPVDGHSVKWEFSLDEGNSWMDVRENWIVSQNTNILGSAPGDDVPKYEFTTTITLKGSGSSPEIFSGFYRLVIITDKDVVISDWALIS